MGVTQAQILAINKNGSGTIDFQKEALSKQNAYPLDAGESKHNILQKRLTLKATGMKNVLKDSDDLYKSIIKLKKTGMLKDMLKRAGIKKDYFNESVLSMLDPNTSAKNIQAFQEMEGAVVSSGGGPIAPMGGFGTMLKDSYPKAGGLGSKKSSKSSINNPEDKTEVIEEFLGFGENKITRPDNSNLFKKVNNIKIASRKENPPPKEIKVPKKEIAKTAKKILKGK
jgi:hypothetical protein